MLRVGLVAAAVVAGVRRNRSQRRTAGHAAAGRADLGVARVRRARARNRAGRRGQVRQGARGRDILIITGRFGFKTLDVTDPDQPEGAGHVPAARDPRRERLLAGRGHGHRLAPQPDHRRARPASRQRRPGELPRDRHLGREDAEPRLPLRLLRDLVQGPGEPASRSATSSTCPRATPSAASTGATTSGPAGRRGATTRPASGRSPRAAAATAGRSGSPISATRRTRRCSRSRSTSGATTA